MISITVLHEGTPRKLTVDLDDTVELLRHQIWSLTGVPIEEQQVTGLGPGVLRADLDPLPVSMLNLVEGTWAMLDRKAPAPSPKESPNVMAPHASSQEQQAMYSRLLSGFATARAYEVPAMQEAARAVVPWERLRATARDARPAVAHTASDAPPDVDELRALLGWFKSEFFTWVDRPACEASGGPTEPIGMAAPSPQERAGGASRVELYRGSTGHVTRFPRYNDPSVLLRTRRGRCGEWANAFTLICRAVGFDARWVVDVTDHVWTEVWSRQQKRWLHADPCEASCDAPLTYERGWGKKLSYVLAFRAHEAVDVTRRYAASWEVTRTRRMSVPEAWLSSHIATLNASAQAMLPPAARQELKVRAMREENLLASRVEQARGLTDVERRGRQTGSLEWRRARGELGRSGGGSVGGGGGAERVVRVCGAVGDVVHGLLFELSSGVRLGALLENSLEPVANLHDEEVIHRRGGRWEVLEANEAIVALHGTTSRIGFLCGEVELTLSSGRVLAFRGGNPDAYGQASFRQAASELSGGDGADAAALGCVHFGDGEYLCAELLNADGASPLAAAASESAGASASDAGTAGDEELLWHGDTVRVIDCSEARRLCLTKAHEPAKVESWATRFRPIRLDGPSDGPVRRSHVVGLFSDGCGRRLNIDKVSVPADGARDGPTTLFELRALDGETPLDEPIRYHQLIGFFGTRARALPPKDVDETVVTTVDVDDHQAPAEGDGEEPASGWRLSVGPADAQATSLDDDDDGAKLHIVPCAHDVQSKELV